MLLPKRENERWKMEIEPELFFLSSIEAIIGRSIEY